jgi:type VI secretion system protein ImpB
MGRESIFDKKARVRPPRVHITYEVEKNGAMVLKELPFVVGVLADLSGQPKEPLAKLKERKFVEIDRDNFDEVLQKQRPRVALKVDNTLKDDGSKLSVELQFSKLEDFEPEQVVRSVKPLAELLEIRGKLKDLLSRTEGNDRLEELLDAIISKNEVREKLAGTLGGEETKGGAAPTQEGSE